jgi:hypothetical protein
MSSKQKAYSTTLVPAEKSMSEVLSILRKRNASGLQWTEEGNKTTLRFMWRSSEGADLCARFIVDIPGHGGVTFQDRERRRMFRVLVYFIKNLFEAVDGGLLTTEQALLPYLEDSSGKTVGELLAPRLGLLASKPLANALGPAATNK